MASDHTIEAIPEDRLRDLQVDELLFLDELLLKKIVREESVTIVRETSRRAQKILLEYCVRFQREMLSQMKHENERSHSDWIASTRCHREKGTSFGANRFRRYKERERCSN